MTIAANPDTSSLLGLRVVTTKGSRVEGEITWVKPAKFLQFATLVYVMWDDGVGGFHDLEDLEILKK